MAKQWLLDSLGSVLVQEIFEDDRDVSVLHLGSERPDDLIDALLNLITSLPGALDQAVVLVEQLPADHRSNRVLKYLARAPNQLQMQTFLSKFLQFG